MKNKVKKCRNCGIILDRYYNWYANVYRLLCIECYRKEARNRYSLNREKILKREKLRYGLYRTSYYQPNTKKRRSIWRKATENAKLKHPDRLLARTELKEAVRKGIIAQLACKVCGNFLSEAHHPDYSKPLEVVWLCKKHHRDEHNRLNGSEYLIDK